LTSYNLIKVCCNGIGVADVAGFQLKSMSIKGGFRVIKRLFNACLLAALTLAWCETIYAAKVVVYNATPVEITLKGAWKDLGGKSRSETRIIGPLGDSYIDNVVYDLDFSIDGKKGDKIGGADSYSCVLYPE